MEQRLPCLNGGSGRARVKAKMSDRIKRALFILMRLYHNQAGNTLAIVAAAVLPLAALIGGGVDMSRAYMAKSRLQQACDAAALAGRRSMTTSSMTANDVVEARKFFDFNFPQNSFQTDGFTPNIRSDPAQTTTVLVSASTRIPTTLMRIFKYEYIDLAVNCSSKFDIGNTDVMLVLDTTGSMSGNISDGSGGSTSRIAALRQAVRGFYDTLGPGNTSTGRVRYGFVPYASNVNVGYLLPSTALVGGTSGETWNYQTRRRYLSGYSTSNSASSWTYVSGFSSNGSGSVGPASSCPSIPNSTTTSTTISSTPAISTDTNGIITTTTVVTRTTNGTTYTQGNCSGGKNNKTQAYTSITYSNYVDRKTETTTQTPQYGWEYNQFPLDVTGYVTGNAITNPANINGVTSTWAGCIEEPDTINTINATTPSSSVPAGANDLNIDLIPSSTATKWRPFWPDVTWYRSSTPATSPVWPNWSGDYAACPARARALAEYTSRDSAPSNDPSGATFNAYLTALTPRGYTNHTTGMVWGARMMSPDGIFSGNNGAAPNGFSISRHIVFMTDGAMTAANGNYDGWGINRLDARIAASNSTTATLVEVQNKRFEIACEAAKRKGITIWIIVFDDANVASENESLNRCASSSDHITISTNAASLNQTFTRIAQNIGGLRLSQ